MQPFSCKRWRLTKNCLELKNWLDLLKKLLRSQTWDSLFWVTLLLILFLLYFILFDFFVFRTSGKKEHLGEDNSTVLAFFTKVPLWNLATWSQPCSKVILDSQETHWQRNLRDIKILREWINIGANSFLLKHDGTEIDVGAWKTISCTKIQACTLKNIAPK